MVVDRSAPLEGRNGGNAAKIVMSEMGRTSGLPRVGEAIGDRRADGLEEEGDNLPKDFLGTDNSLSKVSMSN